MSLDEKLKKLDLLTKLHTSISKTCMDLYQDGTQEHAVKIEEINLYLTMAIEEITKKTLDDWVVLSQKFSKNIEPQLAHVEKSLKEINKQLKETQKIASHIGTIDKAIKSILKYVT